MSTAVVHALLQLDPQRDAHWTSDGLPSLEAVRLLSGDDKITRPLITNAAPSLKRAGFAAWAEEMVKTDPLPPEYPLADAGVGLGAEGEDAAPEPVEFLDEEIVRLKRELDRTLRAKAKAEGEYARAEKRLDEALQRRSDDYPRLDPVVAAQAFIRGQHEQRMLAVTGSMHGSPSRLDLDLRGRRPSSHPGMHPQTKRAAGA